MAKELKNPSRERVDFSKINAVFPMPDLLDIQTQSYREFLQMDLLPEERKDTGLQAALKDVFPISDFKETTELEFLSYSIGTWECKCGRLKGVENSRAKCNACQTLLPAAMELSEKEVCPFCGAARKIELPLCEHCGDRVGLKIKYSPMECIQKGYTYSIPLKLKVQLVTWEKDATTKAKRLKHIKQQEVYFGDIPLMTEKGTFIFNGIERVVVSQLQRSPGVFFRQAETKGFFIAKIIPYRGAWVEFEHDPKGLLWVRLDRKKKFLATVFLRALGFGNDEEILKLFHKVLRAVPEDGKLYWEVSDGLVGKSPAEDVTDAKGRKVLAPAKKKITPEVLAALKAAGVGRVPLLKKEILGAYSLAGIKGKVRTNEPLEDVPLDLLVGRGEPFEVFFPEEDRAGLILSTTLKKDLRKDQPSALGEIYRKLRPGEPHTQESAHNLFQSLFFNPQKYNFSRIGRLKFNIKLGLQTALEDKTLAPRDYVEVLKYLLNLRFGEGTVDDIDHLGNRRVRSVGELVENAFRIGLTRMERTIKEKMTITADLAAAMPQDLINSKPVIAALKEFFGSSQLSQFMDQINSLAEITHKRRLSALGPGGLSRERAGFEVRDIQTSHYGRICPVETPEGPNIGLISSLSCFARVNEYGFIETPYRKVENGRIVDFVKVLHPGTSDYKIGDIVKKDEMLKALDRLREQKARQLPAVEPHCFYLTAWEEEKHNIAQANAVVDDRGRFVNELVSARERGNFKNIPREQLHYIDVSPKQLVSLSAALIPFLEHDDANRALMGSNMQRQAVPLIRPEAPLIGTGIEDLVAVGSGDVIVCRRARRRRVRRRRADHRPGRREGDRPRLRRRHGPLHPDQVPPDQPEHLDQPAAHRPQGRQGRPRAGPGRQLLHRRRRAGPRPQRPLRLHALAGLQLRGRHHRQREAHQGGHLHLPPHRRGDDRGPRHQARPRGDHPGHPQRPREPPPQSRRERHRPHRRPRQVGRHPRRQGRAERGDSALARGEAAQGDLRREGPRRQGRLPLLLARRRGDDHRRPHLLPPGHREGPPGQGHREGRDRGPQEEPRRRDRHHGGREMGEGPGPPQGLDRREGPEDRRPDDREGDQAHREGPRRPSTSTTP